MAAELLRRSLQREGKEIQVASAGVYATDGGPADERAVISARDFGLSLLAHRSRLLTQAIVAESDVLFIMDRRNETSVIGRFPGAKDKLVLLGSFLPRSTRHSIFIADPYGGTIDDVKECYRTIATAVNGLVRHLQVTNLAIRAAEHPKTRARHTARHGANP
jgi:protein-tyrosine phosphatase